jgi:multidrug efflux pump
MMSAIIALIHRPVVSSVINLLIIVLGIFAIGELGVQQYPNVQQPQVAISVSYPGADPSLIETEITTPIEEQISGIAGIKYFSSISVAGASTITITFEMGVDTSVAATQIQNRVSRAQNNFPADAMQPIVSNQAAQPELYLALTSNEWSVEQLNEYYHLAMMTQLQLIPGIEEVQVWGDGFAMRVWIDPDELAARSLTPLDVVNATNAQNIAMPGGTFVAGTEQYVNTSDMRLYTDSDWNDLIISYQDDGVIRLGDVATTEWGSASVPPTAMTYFNNQSVLAMAFQLFPDANAIEVVDQINAMVPNLVATMPADLDLQTIYDRTTFVRDSIEEVFKTIGEAILLVILVVSVFLRSFRSILIPAVTVPLSLCGAFVLIYMLGFSLNVLTLLALVLAIGLVVDDGIVVLENTFRHIEMGKPPLQAAIDGAREISFPVVSTTVTLALVYVPIGFLSGQIGELFRQFAYTLGGTVLISGFIALTLSPMMCAKMLRLSKKDRSRIDAGQKPPVPWYTRIYLSTLGTCLRHLRPVVVAIAIASGFVTYFLYISLPQELLPTEDQDIVMVVYQCPEESSYQATRDVGLAIMTILETVPEGEDLFLAIGVPQTYQGMCFLTLPGQTQRDRTQQEIVKSLMVPMLSIPGGLAIPVNMPPPAIGGSSNQQVNLVLTTINEYSDLEEAVGILMALPGASKETAAEQVDLNLTVPGLKNVIDRDMAAAVGIDATTAAQTLAASLAPYRTSQTVRNGQSYWTYVQTPLSDRQDPSLLDRLFVRNSTTGNLVPMSNFVSIERTIGPVQLNHYNGQRSATINANIAGGSDLGSALDYLESAVNEKTTGVLPQFTGYSQTFQESRGQMTMTFAAGLLVIYLVLSALFNSFLDPLIILLTVPLSLFGAVLALTIAGDTINMYSNIGLITLAGLICKQGILLVDVANEGRDQGMPPLEAALHAGELRVRPILMTTAAMVLGAVPLALATGSGHESRQPLGWVIIGGLLFGTFLSLYVIPVVYSYLAGLESRKPIPPTT